MGEFIQLTASDGFNLNAYKATPDGEVKGQVVVVQEIFGVNIHIREVCDGYAAEGYVALSPALFDRVEPGIELGYESDDMTRGVEIARGKLKPMNTLMDVQAAINILAEQGKVAIVGYCFGGLMTWLAACELSGLTCASGYYGGGIAQQVADNPEQQPTVPTILHFGELDAHIPMADVRAVQEIHPAVAVYAYDSDHGFNCDHRASYNETAAKLALKRTLAFFSEQLS